MNQNDQITSDASLAANNAQATVSSPRGEAIPVTGDVSDIIV